MKKKNKQSGLGDTIEQITKVTGIKAAVDFISDKLGFDCHCEERKKKLNELFPYNKVECLTEDEYLYLTKFDWNVNSINPDIQNKLLKIYNRVFNTNKPPTTCGSCWNIIIQDLKKIYSEY